MSLIIRKAARQNQKLRLLLRGYAGSGKTYSALVFATELAKENPDSIIYYVDTENGSSELYATDFNYQMIDYLENFGEDFNPRNLINVISQIEGPNSIIIVDSLSHFWDGKGGVLEMQDKAGGRFADWAKVNPLYQEFVNCIIRSKSHVIACSRTKTEYALLEGGKKIEKMGTKTVGREGLDYEFTTVLDMSKGGFATADKDRSSLVPKEGVQVGPKLASEFAVWLSQGLPTTFYVTVDKFALLFKKSRDEILDSILKKYQVKDINALSKEQVNEAELSIKATIDKIYKDHEEKKIAAKKEEEKAKKKEFGAATESFAQLHEATAEQVTLYIKTQEDEDSIDSLTSDQLELWIVTLKACSEGFLSAEFLLFLNRLKAENEKEKRLDKKTQQVKKEQAFDQEEDPSENFQPEEE